MDNSFNYLDLEPLELRFHGRAGQGIKLAAQILAETAMNEGYHIQTFPEFGPERRGSPVKAYVRISKSPIYIHSQVEKPDIAAVFEESLLSSIPVCDGLEENQNSLLLVNSEKSIRTIKELVGFEGQIIAIPASKISLFFTKKELPNMPLLGGLIKILDLAKLKKIEDIIKNKFGQKWGREMTEKNLMGLRRGYEEV